MPVTTFEKLVPHLSQAGMLSEGASGEIMDENRMGRSAIWPAITDYRHTHHVGGAIAS